MSGAKLNVSQSEFTESVELMANLSFLSTLVYGGGGRCVGGWSDLGSRTIWQTSHGRAALRLSPQFEETSGQIAKNKSQSQVALKV